MSNDELVRKITNVIRTHANPKQGLKNLKRNQDIVPGIVAIIKNAVGGQATTNALVKNAPVNDLVNSIAKLVRNKVALTPNTEAKIVERLSTNGNQSNELVQKILQSLRQSLPSTAISNQNSNPTKQSILLPTSKMPQAAGTSTNNLTGKQTAGTSTNNLIGKQTAGTSTNNLTGKQTAGTSTKPPNQQNVGTSTKPPNQQNAGTSTNKLTGAPPATADRDPAQLLEARPQGTPERPEQVSRER
jgi:hypothetical protein